MAFTDISIRNLRIYGKTCLEAGSGTNVILGDNASGKTTLLEALAIVATGRSFRTSDLGNVCRHGCDSFEISATSENGIVSDRVAIRVSGRQRRLTLNDVQQKRISEIAARCPILLISPDTSFGFRTRPADRRSAMDWFLFHVKPDFGPVWSRYQRSLIQRNAALRHTRSKQQISVWDQEITETGSAIQGMRNWGVGEVRAEFSRFCQAMVPTIGAVDLQLRPGWREELDLAEALKKDFEKDMSRGSTHSGPHRADLEIYIDGRPARELASQGQLKMLFLAFRFAQAKLLSLATPQSCSVLMDDVAAELDGANQERVLQQIAGIPNQTFLTATHLEGLIANQLPKSKLFHVKQGVITQ